MIAFLVYWVVCFVALAVTLLVLAWIYNLFGGDLGLTGWRRETIIALVTTLLQAGLFALVFAVTGRLTNGLTSLAVVILFLCYKATHASDSLFTGAPAMETSAIIVIGATQFALIFAAALLIAAWLG